MSLRWRSGWLIAAGWLVFAVGCTDTPALSGDDCPEGQIVDDDTGECVAEPDVGTGLDVGDDDDVDQDEPLDPGNCADDGASHPHCDRDDLDEWGDEAADGVPNRYDNCPYHYNPDQTDTAGDGIGDACDNCPHLANPAQESSVDNPYWEPHPHNPDASIRRGDACCNIDGCGDGDDNPSPYADVETDSSGDGVPDIMDNCPDHYNPPTEPDCRELNCPDDPHCAECWCRCDGDYPCEGEDAEWVDDDTAGSPSACRQADSTGDGVGDMCDNCPEDYNPQQVATAGNPAWEELEGWDGHPVSGDQNVTVGDVCAPEPNNIATCYGASTEFEVMAPNVYISLDISGSMSATDTQSGQSRMDEALDGLDVIAAQLADEIRFGLGTYPALSGDSCGIEHHLDVDDYTTAQLQSEWSNYSETGCTPMRASLEDIRDNNRLSNPTDPHDDERATAVLLITDGVPNCDPDGAGCGGGGSSAVDNVVDVIEDLYDDDVLTYAVGFFIDDDSLERFADAGGTGDHYLASDAGALADAMGDIADLLVSCDYPVDPGSGVDPNKSWIYSDATGYLSPDDYTYDESTNVLSINEEACNEIRDGDSDEIVVEIEMGCEDECVPEEPEGYCDFYYETCGEDYPCDTCEPEVCDGTDNNCSGTIDENCPACSILANECESTADCCSPLVCDDGVCAHDCYPVGATCREDDDCCGSCAIESGEEVGACSVG